MKASVMGSKATASGKSALPVFQDSESESFLSDLTSTDEDSRPLPPPPKFSGKPPSSPPAK